MLLRKCDKIVVTSKNYLDSSPDLAKFKLKAEVVPIGINADMSVNHQKINELRSKFNNKTVIFSLGRHVYYKGFDFLIDAASYLNDNFVIVIGGDGPLTRTLRKQVEAKGLNSLIYFTGKIPASEIHSYFEALRYILPPFRGTVRGFRRSLAGSNESWETGRSNKYTGLRC